MATKIQLRRDTEANWTSNNPVLAEGEIGIATDQDLFKIGNGVDNWNSLKYASAPMGTSSADSLSIGPNTTSLINSISVGSRATSEMNSVSVGSSAISEGGSISVGKDTTSDYESISIGKNTISEMFSVSIGNQTKSSDNGINIGDAENTATEGVILIGSSSHDTLKIPAVAGATDGMTLKVNTDGTIYAE